jgi:hypothetical protein
VRGEERGHDEPGVAAKPSLLVAGATVTSPKPVLGDDLSSAKKIRNERRP